MIRSKLFLARCFVCVLLSYSEIAQLNSCFSLVAALDNPAVKKAKHKFRLSKSQPAPKLEIDHSSSASNIETDRNENQESHISKFPDNETDLQSDHTHELAHLTTRRNKRSFAKLVQEKIYARLDAMDRMILRSTLPLVGLTAIVPLLASLDLFWVNQLGDTLAVSAQSAANTLYQFSFGLISFLPSVTATLVSKSFANNDFETTESTMTAALLLGLTASLAISMTIFTNPGRYLGAVLKEGNPARILSVKYMRIRCLSLIPQMITYVCFAAFRGMLDFELCIKVSLVASSFDVILKPLLIHLFRLGVLGSPISTLLCDSFTAISFMKLMKDKGVILRRKKFVFPSWVEISPLLKGSTLQARSFAMHLTNLIVARKIQSLDDTGVIPAAFSLAMQTFFTGGIVIYALGMSAQTLYPNAIAKYKDHDKENYKKLLLRRLLGRGFGVGTSISFLQALLFPLILRTTPLLKVREAAAFPVMTAIAFQGINGIVSVGEGITVGNGKFAYPSIILIVASIGYTGSLQLVPKSWGINGVFLSFGVFNLLRLIGFAVSLPFQI